MLHYDTPYRDQPLLSNREHEMPCRGFSRRPCSARWPTEKSEIVIDGEAEKI